MKVKAILGENEKVKAILSEHELNVIINSKLAESHKY